MGTNLVENWGKSSLDRIFESMAIIERVDNFDPDDPNKFYV